jgi:hypothetical protein
VKELVLKNSKVIICEVLVCWEFHLGEFRAFGKTIRTYVELLPDLCSVRYVWIGKKIVLVHARSC